MASLAFWRALLSDKVLPCHFIDQDNPTRHTAGPEFGARRTWTGASLAAYHETARMAITGMPPTRSETKLGLLLGYAA